MLGVLLVAAVGATCAVALHELPPVVFAGKVVELLPTESQFPRWSRHTEDSSKSLELPGAVKMTLNFDDAVYAKFSDGMVHVDFFVAHWEPGKMPPRLIAGHTPDVCWVQAGWRCEAACTNDRLSIGDVNLLPAQERTMVINERREYVLFWHVVGDRVYNYGTDVPPWYAPLSDLLQQGLMQKQEQLFVRISSNQPISELWACPIVRRFVKNWVASYPPAGRKNLG